jgi:hypothetical protein
MPDSAGHSMRSGEGAIQEQRLWVRKGTMHIVLLVL